MVKKTNVVVKVPNENINIGSNPQIFPKMPILYLELLENKAKIRQDLINKDYIPQSSDLPSMEPISASRSYSSDTESEDEVEGYSHRSEPSSDEKSKTTSDNVDDERSEIDTQKDEGSPSPSEDGSEKDDGSVVEDTRSDDGSVVEDTRSDDGSVVEDTKSDDESVVEDTKSDDGSVVDPSPSSPQLTNRLEQLLGESDDEASPPPIERRKKKKNKYSVKRDNRGRSISKTNLPPTFSQLQENGTYVPRRELRDINQVSKNEDQTEDMKRELLFKFELLKKSYPNGNIPTYTVHTDYKTMVVSYEDCVRRLSLDSSIESYKQYLIYAFMGLEFLLGKFLKLDMKGFTQQQIISMSSYEKLLIELGEKSYIPDGSQWSVEVRLLFLVMMNTAFFVVSKMIMNKTSVNLMNMMNSMSTPGTKSSNSSGDSKPKRKMKSPDVNLDDLP